MRNALLATVVAVGLACIGCHHEHAEVAPATAAANVVSAPVVVAPVAPAAVDVAPPPTATVADETPPPAPAKATKVKSSRASKSIVATRVVRKAKAAPVAAPAADADTTKSGLKKMTNDDPYAAATMKTASFDTHPYD